ncbi:hypothetical protein DFP72DRAFT_922295 [Ephemerocybe angulata]|uniref:Uncharacterized protein n=1 Tax=Ephemerocybe angulata TaxID=980116 RepID=A0A8H6M011_9AGAR|nr:hypothetical protein DFP72DRAFT_922295 [Tulosesus angulatus]
MQGVNALSLFTEFPDRTGARRRSEGRGRLALWWGSISRFCSKKRLGWYVLWMGLALHTTSIVAILQPEKSYKSKIYNDPIPCAAKSTTVLTLDREEYLSWVQQTAIDKFSFDIGLQFGNYVDQVSGNTTTSVAGRNYKKENVAFGAVGGLENGLQDIPDGQDTTQSTALWQASLPVLSPPKFSLTNFSEVSTIPPAFGRIISHPSLSFNLSLAENAMYGVVDPLGNGALMTLGPNTLPGSPLALVCTWKAIPKLVHVQMVNFTARSLSTDDAPGRYPSLTGRATLKTLEGMAQSARYGGTIDPGSIELIRSGILDVFGTSYYTQATSTTQVLEILLADGVKAGLTAYNVLFRAQRINGQRAMRMCNSNNKTVQEHWRFGNSRNLGWIAMICTSGVGLLGVATVLWSKNKGVTRLIEVSPLGATGGFVLGRGEAIDDHQLLCVRNGKIVDVESEEKTRLIRSSSSG